MTILFRGEKLKLISLFIILLTASISWSQPISASRTKAALIYQRIAGVKISIDSPIIDQMDALVAQGRLKEAAELATETDQFLNITIKHMAARMSTREETVNSEFSDFVATFVGAVRDNKSAKTLLTGNYYYHGDMNQVEKNDLVDDVIRSNEHYEEIESERMNLATILVEAPNQLTLNNDRQPASLPDTGGLLTTRAFTQAHAIAGTNRRMVHYAFRSFLCIDVAQWADSSLPDTFVGRDVDRAPAGSPAEYLTTCKGCHAPLDGLKGAFAHIQFGDFNNGYVQHGTVQSRGNGDNRFRANNQFPQIADKYYRNAQTYPSGHLTTDASWVNNLTFGENAKYFGWRNLSNNSSGLGIKQFGRMMADSEAFSRCMVRRAYRASCKRETSNFESEFVAQKAQEFEIDNYNIKKLFASVASSNECIGQ